MPAWVRRRLSYLALAIATIAVGLTVHFGTGEARSAVRDVVGDALWASMIVWWCGVIAPSASVHARAAAALGICFAVELSQLYRHGALDALRATTPGHLLLGSGFDPRDLLAYAAGVAGATLLLRFLNAANRDSIDSGDTQTIV